MNSLREGGRGGPFRTGGHPVFSMSETYWVAVLKARGVMPHRALAVLRRGLKPNTGLVFVGKSGLLAMLQREEDLKALPLRIVPPEPGEHEWVTAARIADRTVIVWDESDGASQYPPIARIISEKRPVNVVKPCGMMFRWREGQLAGWTGSDEIFGISGEHGV